MRYYLVAILFILFDLEIAFLFLGPLRCKDMGGRFSGCGGFPGILVVGFAYEWKKARWTGNDGAIAGNKETR
jgi:NADH-quinone oxidoreductase subunit A